MTRVPRTSADLHRAMGPASELARAARGLAPAQDVVSRMLEEQRRFERILQDRPTLFEDAARGQAAFSDLLRANPNVFENMARGQMLFDRYANGDLAAGEPIRLQELRKAQTSVASLASGIARRDMERVIGIRAMTPDPVVDTLARAGSLSSFVANVAGMEAIPPGVARQLDELSGLMASAAGQPSRADLEARFPDIVPALRLPTVAEIADVDLLRASGVKAAGPEWTKSLADEMAGVTTPWVLADRPELSIGGYAAFRGLTDMVARSRPGAPRVSEAVRARLGDYREEFEETEIDDAMLVSGFRHARGFDEGMAGLPMALVGALFEPFGMATGPASEIDPQVLEDIVSAMMRRLEKRLRAFIDERMSKAVGPKWITQRVPKEMRQSWEARRQQDADNGRPTGEPIEYADFAHYRIIIEQGDNWKDCFRDVFRRKPAVQESLARLSSIRNPSAHVRPLVTEDLLILRVEGRQMYAWMGDIVP